MSLTPYTPALGRAVHRPLYPDFLPLFSICSRIFFYREREVPSYSGPFTPCQGVNRDSNTSEGEPRVAQG